MRRGFQLLAATLSGLTLGGLLHAQVVTINQSFTGTTAPGWVLGGTGYTPTLTAASGIDASGSGWLRMTDTGTNEATYAYNPTPFASANATITAQFNYASWGGTGADGITFFLADASQPFSVGAYGGSLGYAQKTAAGGATDVNGMSGGYLGLGIDEYGNFSNPTEGRVGGPGFYPGNVSVRGPGSGLTGYNYLGGTAGNYTFPQPIDYPSNTTRPSGSEAETFQIVLTSTNQLSVSVEFGNSGTFTQIFTASLSGYTRPDNLIMGFTAGSGASTDIHEIQNVVLSSISANIWTNKSGDSNWTTANDWYGNPAVVPTVGSDVLLNNNQVSTAQNISVTGGQIIRSLQIDAPFSYTLTGTGNLEFNNEGVAGPTGIIVTSANGTSASGQTINTNTVWDNSGWVENNTTTTLTLGGSMTLTSTSAGPNTVSFNGSGATNVTGSITGAGAIVQSGAGTTTFTSANTYTGGTTISAGTLNANNSAALGSGGITLSGGTLGSTNASSISNTIALTGNAGLSGITTSGALTQTGGSYTLTMANATQSGNVSLSNSSTNQTLTVGVASGNTGTISGVISNGSSAASGLTKSGGGTLTLSGVNTYTGATTVTGGTLSLGANNGINSSSALTLQNNATFALNGHSESIGLLTFTNGGTIDFGAGSSNLGFVVNGISGSSTGVLTLDNWTKGTGGTQFASTSNSVTSVLQQIYFAGYGSGAAYATSTSTVDGVTSYVITPGTTLTTWSGAVSTTSTAWNTTSGGKSNWVGNGVPSTSTTSTQKLDFTGTTGLGPVMNQNYSANAIIFDTAAGAFNINQNAKTLTLSGNVPSIIQESATAQTISNGTITWGNNATNVNGVIDVSGTGSLTISSAMTSTSAAVNISKLSSGTLILTGANGGLSTGWIVQGGTLEASGTNTSILGTGAINVDSGATLETAGGAGIANAISVSGTGYNGQGAILGAATATISGAVTLASDTTITATSGTLTFSSGVGGSGNLTVNRNTGSVNFSGVIATGSNSLVLNGTGSTTLTGANTFTGTTTVNGGTLALNTAGGGALAGNLVIGSSSGGAATVTEAASGELSSSATVTMNSAGVWDLNSHTESIASLTGAAGSTIALSTSTSVPGGTLTVSGTGSTTYAGTITGTSATLNKSNTGSLWLSGNNSGLSGTVNVSNGVLGVEGSNTALGSTVVNVTSAGNFEVQGGLTMSNNFNLSSTGASTGNGAIENLSGNNTLTGNITVSAASQIQSDSGTLTLSGPMSLSGNSMGLVTSTASGAAGAITISGAISGTSAAMVTISGPGTVTLSGNNASYQGGYTVSDGTLQTNSTTALNSKNNITFASGSVLALNGNSESTGTINGSGTISFGSGSAVLTLGAGTSLLSGAFTGTGTLVIGAGTTLTLGANFSDSGLNITLAGGTLNLNGTNDTFGTLSITSASTIDFASSANSLVNFSSVTDTNGSLLTVSNWSDSKDYFYSSSNPGSTTLGDITFTGYGNHPVYQTYTSGPDSNFQITPTPEPSTYGAIFVGAMLGGTFYLRRRKAARA